VWNNTGDKAYLRNADFVLRDTCEWTSVGSGWATRTTMEPAAESLLSGRKTVRYGDERSLPSSS
jgi:hypothetical protein